MIKGTRVEARNAYNIGTGTTNYNLVTIPTGKTFVLTDLNIGMTYADGGDITTASAPVLKLFDFVGSGSTGASAQNAVARLTVNMECTPGLTAAVVHPTGITLHFENGGEFSNGVTPVLAGDYPGATNCLWISGIYR